MRKSVPRSRRQYVFQSPALDIARDLPGIRTAPLPDFVEPALASLSAKPPRGDRWVCEIKYDGYRFQMHRRERATRMFTRRGYDWSKRTQTIVRAASQLKAREVVLDGEVVVQTPDGLQDFAALESAIGKEQPDDRLLFYAFDILYLDFFDLRGCKLLDRKLVLQTLLESVKDPIRYSEHFETDGPEFWENACKFGFEGSVSKFVTSPYQSGRTNTWMKTTCRHRDTFVVAGWAEKRGKFDGVYLGREEEGKLVYAGKLERGFSEEDKSHILAMFEKLKAKKQPIEASRRFPKANWLKPQVLVDAEFRGKTGEGLLRHPAFKGVRRDLME